MTATYTTYTLEDFKNIICYRLSPGDTDLPSIPFFDMAITFYMLLWNIGTIGASPADDEDENCESDDLDENDDLDDLDEHGEAVKNGEPDERSGTVATDNPDKPYGYDEAALKHLLESGIFEYVDGFIISPITSDSLRLLNCSIHDLLPIAKLNTPELNPPKMLRLDDAVFLTTHDGLYGATAMLYDGATAMLYEGLPNCSVHDKNALNTLNTLSTLNTPNTPNALKEVSEVLQTSRFHLLPISEHGVLCTNSLTLERKKALMMNEQKPLTRSVYEYKDGAITAII
ncbi:MAG: hypothetical protein IJ695_05870 [Butyrivibrio sp.]|nr:hypothetical protein [Butyrivibrio sp.]